MKVLLNEWAPALCINAVTYRIVFHVALDFLYSNKRATNEQTLSLSYLRVRTGHGKPGKSWNLSISFSRPGKCANLCVVTPQGPRGEKGSKGEAGKDGEKVSTCAA